MPGVIARATRVLVGFVRAPRQTWAMLPGLIESARMRMVGDSTFRRDADLVHASNCPARTIDRVLSLWRPASVLDVGCGTGKVIDYLLSRGLTDVQGLEGSAPAIRAAAHPDRIRQADLSHPVDLGRRFDMVYCVEVAEHIRPDAADVLVDTCARHADHILFSA